MTSLELLKEIEAWLSFNTEPSKEETAKLRKSINDHVAEQLNLPPVSRSFLLWLQEVVNIDNKQQFMLDNEYLEELTEWVEWYKKGLSPDDAVKTNFQNYD